FQYIHAKATGFDYRSRSVNERPWTTATLPGTNQLAYPERVNDFNFVYGNYRTTFNEFTLQLVGSINNIRFHKGKNTGSLYGLIGGGLMSFDPRVNAINDATGLGYDFYTETPNSQPGATGLYKDRKAHMDWYKN